MKPSQGSDTFVFDEALGTSNIDSLSDFSIADVIHLDNSIFTGLSDGALLSANFESNTSGTATGTTDQVVYNSSNGELGYYDASGTGAVQFFAQLGNTPALTVADIVVI